MAVSCRRCVETKTCPFKNLPESRHGQWGEGLTATDMEEMPLAEPAAGGDDWLSETDRSESLTPLDVRRAEQKDRRLKARRAVRSVVKPFSAGLAAHLPSALSSSGTVAILNAIDKRQPVLRLPRCVDQLFGPQCFR